jgi:hypothetical protein
LTTNALWEIILTAALCFGVTIWSLWDLLAEEGAGWGKTLLWVLLVCVVVFGFYSLLYRHKMAMLIIWCVATYGLVLYLDDNLRLWPAGLLTVVFAAALHVFMTGYSPAVKGVPEDKQDNDWWWRNVIVQDQDGYRLRDAVDGKDVLGLSFSRHDGRYMLVYPIQDSLTYSARTWILRLPGEENEFKYIIYSGFESKVHKLAAKGDLVAQVFNKSRLQVFDGLSGRPSSVVGEDAKACFRELLANEERETVRLLEEESPSVVKNQITRQLCKGISCSWLANGIGKDMSVSEDAYFAFLAAFSAFTSAFYQEEFASEETEADWDGVFEKMMSNLRSAAPTVETPHDSYLEEVLPRLIDRYYDSDDYGQDNILWGEIVRMQQLAVLCGLGDKEWARKIILSPVVEQALQFYNSKYEKRGEESLPQQ